MAQRAKTAVADHEAVVLLSDCPSLRLKKKKKCFKIIIGVLYSPSVPMPWADTSTSFRVFPSLFSWLIAWLLGCLVG